MKNFNSDHKVSMSINAMATVINAIAIISIVAGVASFAGFFLTGEGWLIIAYAALLGVWVFLMAAHRLIKGYATIVKAAECYNAKSRNQDFTTQK